MKIWFLSKFSGAVLRKREISNSSRTEATRQIIKILSDMEIVIQESKEANWFPVYQILLYKTPGESHVLLRKIKDNT